MLSIRGQSLWLGPLQAHPFVRWVPGITAHPMALERSPKAKQAATLGFVANAVRARCRHNCADAKYVGRIHAWSGARCAAKDWEDDTPIDAVQCLDRKGSV